MKEFLEKLRQQVAENPPNYGDADSVLGLLYECFNEIAYDSLERTFGAFLASQKNSRSLQIKTKANKGKGRFSCFSFASLAEWSTVTATPDGNIAYTISLENADKNQCDVSDPAPTTRSTGTRLIISGIDGSKLIC